MCGLIQTSPSFRYTGNEYINEYRLYDFRLISTIGFDDDDIAAIQALPGVADAVGAYSADVIARFEDQDETSEQTVRIHSVTDGVNLLRLEAGRFPENENEIVLDGYNFGEDAVGRTLVLRNDRVRDYSENLTVSEFTVVGLVRSPVYMNFQRGASEVGNGQLSCYAYVLQGVFNMEYYSESYVYFDTGLDAYGDEYENWADAKEDELEDQVLAVITDRFDELLEENRADLNDGIAEFEDERHEASLDLDDAREELDDAYEALSEGREELNYLESQFEALPVIPPAYQEAYDEALSEYEDGVREYNDGLVEYYEGLRELDAGMTAASSELNYMAGVIANTDDPKVYVLGRDKNIGAVAFETDADIVKGIANVFPLFFFALAALVCSTTMQRMVLDERGIIGTMRALGYTDLKVTMKYVIYSGLAAVIGSVTGYLIGVRLFPSAIWEVYGMMYGFSDLKLKESLPVFIIAIGASLLCSVGVAFVTAASEVAYMPAELIRPKAPPAGKKILLEKMTSFWSRLSFKNKVSLRNVFRFKKRMLMMVIGIAGCSALLLTGFGIRDSITDVVDLQYDNITTYRLNAKIEENASVEDALASLRKANDTLGTAYEAVAARSENLTHVSPDAIRDVTLFISDDDSIGEALKGRVDGVLMPWPGDGKIAISSKLAERNGLKAGDMITFGYGDDGMEFTLRIAYVFENYTFHYAFMNVSTYEEVFGRSFRPTNLLITCADESSDSDYDMARELNLSGDFERMDVTEQSRIGFSETMEKLNVIVVLIIGCAAALAFIVLFNLNNINISERVREIATIKVLGFSEMETGAYFFRENFLLIFMGFVLGLPFGIALHRFVISQIEMDMVTFVVKIRFLSYIYSLILVILFSVLVDLVMRIKIKRIDMAESLKSAE